MSISRKWLFGLAPLIITACANEDQRNLVTENAVANQLEQVSASERRQTLICVEASADPKIWPEKAEPLISNIPMSSDSLKSALIHSLKNKTNNKYSKILFLIGIRIQRDPISNEIVHTKFEKENCDHKLFINYALNKDRKPFKVTWRHIQGDRKIAQGSDFVDINRLWESGQKTRFAKTNPMTVAIVDDLQMRASEMANSLIETARNSS